MKKFYITTPIYYVNDAPHIGHAYTTVAADLMARYHRLLGREVFFLTGTDEHGQKVQQAAAKRGVSPQQHADEWVTRFQDLWARLAISNNDFIRTTEARHTSAVQEVLQRLWDKEEIYLDSYEGWYCLPDERFWTEKELADGKCPDCGRPVESLQERNYFFKMGKYQDLLRRHIDQNPSFIQPESRRREVLGFLEKPLGDLCISRPKSRLSWGVVFPFDPDYVTYVWVDALVNYISVPGYPPGDSPRDPNSEFLSCWPADLHLVGKDILTTHAVYWSTLLMALDLPLPNTLFAHGWWTVDGEKMSKSRGNVVDPNEMIEAFGTDAFRYFLLREVPFGQDGNFSKEAFIVRYNSDLANDLGNLLSRTLNLMERFSDGKIPEPAGILDEGGHPEEEEIKGMAIGLYDSVRIAMTRFEFHTALGEIWRLVDRINRYIEQMAPWSLAKNPKDKKRLDTVLYTAAEALRMISLYLSPFMPNTAEEMRRQLGGFSEDRPLDKMGWGHGTGQTIAKGRPLFPRIEREAKVAPESKTAAGVPSPSNPLIAIEDFKKLDLRAGTILEAAQVKGSDKLLLLTVDIGDEKRQVVAGIGKRYRPDSLIGRKVILVANLKPVKIMGIESQGMLLAAGGKEVLGLATFIEEIPPGAQIR